MTRKESNDIRAPLMKDFIEWAEEKYGTALIVKSNKVAVSVLDKDGYEHWAEYTIALPTGSHDDDEPYDAEHLNRIYLEQEAINKQKAEAREAKKKADAEKRRKEKEKLKKKEVVGE